MALVWTPPPPPTTFQTDPSSFLLLMMMIDDFILINFKSCMLLIEFHIINIIPLEYGDQIFKTKFSVLIQISAFEHPLTDCVRASQFHDMRDKIR
jgi:hypothetical protein